MVRVWARYSDRTRSNPIIARNQGGNTRSFRNRRYRWIRPMPDWPHILCRADAQTPLLKLMRRVLTYRNGVTLVGAESSPAPRHSGLHKLETSIDNRTLVPILQR